MNGVLGANGEPIAILKITLKNHLRVTEIPPELSALITRQLTLPNPRYLENLRMGRWNRGVPKELFFFDRLRGGGLILPRGFIRQLITLCRSRKVPYSIDDQRRTLPDVGFRFQGELHSFQKGAVHRVLRKEFGTLCAPTGSGKTVMALYIIAQRRQPALIIVHTRDLADQWAEGIERFLKIPPQEIGMIGGGRKKIGNFVTVSLVQSLYKCADEMSTRVGHLVVDECHRTPSRTFTDAVSEFDSKYMLGLSATPWRRDKLSKLIFCHLGDISAEVDKKELERSGNVLRADVVFRKTAFKPFHDPVTEYSKMLSELTMNDERNRMIADDVAEEAGRPAGGICLVLSDRKKHCEALFSLVRFKHNLAVAVLTGDVGADERARIKQRLNRGEIDVLIATGQLIGEGFDCKDLTSLFLATPVRFSGRVIQYLGRILRPAPGKDRARVFDYVDVQVEPLLKAARARRKIYTE